jgi:hypothetical protein
MKRGVWTVCLLLLAGWLCVSQAASTYNIPLTGSEGSPGVSINMKFASSGVLAGGLQIRIEHEKGTITGGEWTLATASGNAGTIRGKVTGGSVTFDQGRVAALVNTSLTVTGGSGAFAAVKDGSGTLAGSNDANNPQRSKSFKGYLTLAF